jgi:hypothetical protein
MRTIKCIKKKIVSVPEVHLTFQYQTLKGRENSIGLEIDGRVMS